MIADPYGATPVVGAVDPYYSYDQGRMQQCCQIALWIVLSLLLLGLLIWFVRWLTTPSYVAPIYRHNLISSMHNDHMA